MVVATLFKTVRMSPGTPNLDLYSESLSRRLKNYVNIPNRSQCSLSRHVSCTVPYIALLVRMKLLCCHMSHNSL